MSEESNENGKRVAITEEGPRLVDIVRHGRLVLDGKKVLPLDADPLRERRRVMEQGFLTITLVLDDDHDLVTEPRVVSLGIAGARAVERAALEAVENAWGRLRSRQRRNREKVAELVRLAARRACEQVSGRKPVTDVQIIALPSADWPPK